MSVEIVRGIKQDLLNRGVDLSGPCGAFAITSRVAWGLRDSGAGLLDKPGGNNCNGYATDYIVFLDGSAFDILGDGGGANVPQWNADSDRSLLARWRAPFNPDPVPVPKPVPVPVEPAHDRFTDVLAALDALRIQNDANTEKIQTQLNGIVKNAETTLKKMEPLLKFLS